MLKKKVVKKSLKTSKAKAKAKSKKKIVKAKAVKAEIIDHTNKEIHGDEQHLEQVTPINNQTFAPEDHNIEFSDDSALAAPLLGSASKAVSTTDPLSLYLAEIRKYPLLTKEQELTIAKRYFDTKDPEAAQELVRANLRFVVKIAAEYSRFGSKMIDLIQEGNVGLMHAVKEFNPYKGARLITYAVWWIRGYIQEYLMRQYSLVRIGTTQNQRKLFYQLQKEKEALDALGNITNFELLSEKLGIPKDEIIDMSQRMSGRDISLDKPLDDESPTSLLDYQKSSTSEIPLDEQLAKEEQLEILKTKIEEIRPTLNEKEKIILEERVLSDSPLTLQEIGEKYKITREAVRQAEARLLKKIKEKMNAE